MSQQQPQGWTAPPQQQPQVWGAPQPEKAKKKHRFLKLLGGIVAFFIVLGVVASLGDDGTTTTSTEEPASSSESKEKASSDEPTVAKVGQPAKDGDFTFTVKKIEKGPARIGDQYLGTKAQGQFWFVHVTVENHGDEAGSFFGDNQYLYDTKGRKASADTEAAVYLDESESLWEEINPGNKVDGVVVFDLAKEAVPASLELHDSAFSGGVKVSVK